MTKECPQCTTLFAPDLDHCPHCVAEYREDDVPKISAEGGPSYAGVDSPAEGLTAEETSADDRYPFTVPDKPAAESPATKATGTTTTPAGGPSKATGGTSGTGSASGTSGKS